MNTLTTQACLRTYNRLFKENDELYHEIARCFGLSDCALWILYTIREEEQALTQSDICESLFLPRQTIHSAIKKPKEQRTGSYKAGTASGGTHRRSGNRGRRTGAVPFVRSRTLPVPPALSKIHQSAAQGTDGNSIRSIIRIRNRREKITWNNHIVLQKVKFSAP